MGYFQAEGRIMGFVSRHNSDKDIRHNMLWDDLVQKIKHISSNSKYKELNLQINLPESEDF